MRMQRAVHADTVKDQFGWEIQRCHQQAALCAWEVCEAGYLEMPVHRGGSVPGVCHFARSAFRRYRPMGP